MQNINQQYQTSIYNINYPAGVPYGDRNKLQSIVAPNRQADYEYEQAGFESAEQKSLYREDGGQYRPRMMSGF